MSKLLSLLVGLCFMNIAVAQNVVAAPDSSFDKEFEHVQIEAQFPGGLPAWKKYLEKNLNTGLADKYLKIPKGEKSVRQTVIVSFRVDRNGAISNVVAENAKDVHPKLAAEAVRVIKNGPRWMPAVQDGKKVIYRQRQSITWVLEAE